MLQAAVAWAAMHSVDSLAEAATVWDHGETGMPVAGPGAPLVAEFSVTEFAAAIGLPTEAGKAYLGEAVELRYRLPRVWTRVVKGDLPAWRARRIARQTLLLSPEAAAHVDRHVAHVAHKIRPAQVDRLVEEAIGRFMPEEADRRRRQAADGRNFTIDTNQPSLTGTSAVYGELDLADALDLDAAVDRRRPGAEGPRLHRHPGRAPRHRRRGPRPPPAHPRPQPHPRPHPGRPQRRPATGRRRRPSAGRPHGRHEEGPEAASGGALRAPLRRRRHPGRPVGGEFGRVENTRGPVHAEQIRQWCGNPDADITVQPVLDLNEHIDVEAYEIRGRLREQTILTHPTCVFPWCTRPARALEPDEHDADCDHRVPHATVKHSCSCNAAPLCRRHHRAKTHGRWTYKALERGTYVWTSPHGYQYLRDHHGTLDVSRDRHPTPRTPAPTARTRQPPDD